MHPKDTQNNVIPFPAKGSVRRTLSSKEYNALPFAERLDMVRRAAGRRKFDLIIDAADAERIVQVLPAQETYLLLRELGPDDAAELFAMSSTEQLTFFMDMDGWNEDRMEGESLDRWMEFLLEGGEEKVLKTFHEMDFELLVLLFKKRITILRGPEAYEDEDQKPEIAALTGGYDLEFNDPEKAKVTAALLDVLARKEMEFYVRLLEGVRWEHESALEEEVYRFRSGRLQDHGFPDPFEARRIYAGVDPDAFDPRRTGWSPLRPEEEAPAPGFVMTVARPRDLLAEILSEGIDSETSWELTFLLNKVMTADSVDPGEADQVRAAMEDVFRAINIALEYRCGADMEGAAKLFGGSYIENLFRIGFSLTLGLRRRAQEILRSPVGPWLDPPFRAFVDALNRPKPCLFEGLSEEGRGGERPFANLKDIRVAGKWLDRLGTIRTLFEERFPFDLPNREEVDLSGCHPDNADELTLSDLFLTALANRLLGRDFYPHPLRRGDLPLLHDRLCSEETLLEDLIRETVSWLASLEEGAGAYGEYCLEILKEDFCSLNRDEIDPRYVSGLIVGAD